MLCVSCAKDCTQPSSFNADCLYNHFVVIKFLNVSKSFEILCVLHTSCMYIVGWFTQRKSHHRLAIRMSCHAIKLFCKVGTVNVPVIIEGTKKMTLLYLSVSMCGVIGQFCRPYFTVQPAKFESCSFPACPNITSEI